MPNPELIGSTKAATILGISARTVHRLVKAGDMTPAITAPGGYAGVYLFTREEVDRVKAERAEKASA